MASELVPRKQARLEQRKKLQAQFLQFMLESGKLYYVEASEAIAKGNKKKAKMWRQRWRRWMQNDEDFQAMVGNMSMAHLRSGIPQAVEALNRRASKGNVPAIKLAMEASGFHNPRTITEHVGEIAINIRGIQRPPSVVDEDTVVDAEVVDED